MPGMQPYYSDYQTQNGGYGQPQGYQQPQGAPHPAGPQGPGGSGTYRQSNRRGEYEGSWDDQAKKNWDDWTQLAQADPGYASTLRNQLTRDSQNRAYLNQKTPTYQAPNDAKTMQQYGAGLERLNQQSQTGLMPEDLAAFWQARAQVGDFASQQRGAVQQQAQMQGGGVATGGNTMALQDQANQAGANRLAGMDMSQAGIASQRRQQALLGYLHGLAGQQGMEFRNSQAINDFNQQNFGNNFALQNAYQQRNGAQDAADSASNPLNTILNVAGSVGAPVAQFANQKGNGAATQGSMTQMGGPMAQGGFMNAGGGVSTMPQLLADDPALMAAAF